jgi:nitroimidazol reductase NimA-like FMN-containing flavoprotein (pyridoxamine 5'-phosphate oxidase superfamily)
MSVEELQEFGLESMNETEIKDFLNSHHVGILGLPASGVPYMVPLSYGFDGDSHLYFTYALGAESQKETLTEQAETARFLVYTADSPYMWQSVLLTGPITAVPESEEEEIETILSDVWRPELLANAGLSRGVRIYELTIEERSGIKHTGLPPAFEPSE